MNKENYFLDAKEALRENLCKYTRQAFYLLPELNKPRILDIGCGMGVPTMELAKLSDGQVTGVDINQTLLGRLEKKIKEAGLSERVKTVHCSMTEMNFPIESFDIIWAEGSIAIIGFERGLIEWGRLLKPNGVMVVHDDLGDLACKIGQIAGNGYELLNSFTLSENIWWKEYYEPMEDLIKKTKTERAGKPELLDELKDDERELDLFRNYPARFRSVFFIMKKLPVKK